ncbi:MAG: autotransporter outer membrane beta-barrel domain-containing protein [Phascolarctobacterium sp.]|nr:autotransporter outer membrane beta-barrel domain-containing protein [Phascolarctobacterium sp.]
MSKKIMKRSLALGALMAFVITGSAWANQGANVADITATQSVRITDTSGKFTNTKYTGINTTSTNYGGVMKVTNEASFNNCYFVDNEFTYENGSAYGGVISVFGSSSDVTIDKCTFEDNYAKSGAGRVYGAVIQNTNGKLTINDSYFTKTSALGTSAAYGFVMSVSGGITEIKNTTFENNGHNGKSSDKDGGNGVIYLTGAGTLKLNNVKFKNTDETSSNAYGYGNFIHNRTDSNNKIIISGDKNEFINAGGRAIWNGGVVTFTDGSKTKFEKNDVDIENDATGIVNIEKGSVVNLANYNGIKGSGVVNITGMLSTLVGNISGTNIVNITDKGAMYGNVTGTNTVNINDGTLTGNITGASTVKVDGNGILNGKSSKGTFIFESGTWNLNGDSKVNSIVVNGNTLINGKLEGSDVRNALKPVTHINNKDGYVINHTAGNLAIKNITMANIYKISETGIGNGSLLFSDTAVDGAVTIEDSTIKNNWNLDASGVVYVAGKELNISGSELSNNLSHGNGGFIYFADDTMNVKKSEFNGNMTESDGGAIYLHQGVMNIDEKTVFSNNVAIGKGGAIYNTANSIVNFDGSSTFTGNKSGVTIEQDATTGELYSVGGIANDVYNDGTININSNAKVTLNSAIDGTGTTNINGGILELGGNDNKIGILKVNDNGKLAFGEKGHLDVDEIDESSDIVTITMVGKDADDLNTKEQLTTVAERMGVAENYKATDKVKVVMTAGEIVGETTGDVVFETKVNEDGVDYYHGVVKNKKEEVKLENQAISDAGIGLKLHYRYHINDMNKRMGELRNANGEHGVWTRMVRGECEYENSKAQYNQYQLGYDEKLSVDKRWTVGAAVTFSEGDSSYGYGSTEDKSTAFAIYGSKLNNDGTFVDLIARYAHLESDIEDKAGKGDYSTNGMSVSAEFGKRIQQGNGLWIEPQFELTYGNFDSAEFQIGGKTVQVGDMDSLIGRIGFSLGKDIKQGNVYARASYLYDFDGETETAFSNASATRTFKDDLGGGWWEVGVGANINLSKATYIYADVEKAFGGEVDTNWQWNLGVRYSF